MSHRPVGQEHWDNYREKINDLPDLEPDWFAASLAAFRTGDIRAGQEINHSCLKVVLRLVAAHGSDRDPETLLTWANDCNITMKQALKRFSGITLAEYLMFIEEIIQCKLDELSTYS